MLDFANPKAQRIFFLVFRSYARARITIIIMANTYHARITQIRRAAPGGQMNLARRIRNTKPG